jgi:hypothetical protein
MPVVSRQAHFWSLAQNKQWLEQATVDLQAEERYLFRHNF